MTARTIQLLHVEDDEVQRLLTARLLKSMQEYQFDITCVDSEDEAVAHFEGGDKELVILDYHLAHGNGLSCLREMRKRRAKVPIIVVSGEATPQVAAELLESGADDYISKMDLNSTILSRSVRTALARADAWRRLVQPAQEAAPDRFRRTMMEFVEAYPAIASGEFLRRLDDLEASARACRLNDEQLPSTFDALCVAMAAGDAERQSVLQKALRSVFLEMLVRLREKPES